MMRRLTHMLARLRRGEDGNASIEFVILFPVFIAVFASAFEAGLVAMRHSMLDRALDLAVRDLRLGDPDLRTHDDLKDAVCNYAGIIPECDESLHLELERISKENWSFRTGQVQCIDRDEDITPAVNFTPGTSNDMMLITACAVFSPMVPISGLGLKLPRVNGGEHYALISMSAYVNEPS